ncbi:MAG: flagellar hook assembly protein FlgD [Gammaproteobacteria bacterium]|nr:flagellar hook assembly protein FlgD [Gammaproteobacteria bacterium]MDH5594764.1 flagellar hook assembly protein FlgD [Gammaproteobacteria bacterium]MDH5614322.1 flagellar hook assembly protein FlgD [Gammaproteobacteria bacterium]
MSTIDTNGNDLAALGLAVPKQKLEKAKLGQEAFFELMLTQLNNQDPLKPMENGDFLGQIAQFGTVSGIQDLQNSFSTLSNALTSNQALQASSLIGRTVLIDTADSKGRMTGSLEEGGQIVGAVGIPVSTQQAVINITDSSGQLVRKINLGEQKSGEIAFAWDGTIEEATDGKEAVMAGPGQYKFSATILYEGKQESVGMLIADTVSSVTLGNNGEGMRVNLIDNGSLNFGDIKRIM